MKAKRWIETIVDNQSIDKESLNSSEIKRYKAIKIERVFEDFKQNNLKLVEVNENENLYLPKKNKLDKPTKKPTTQTTYEMWLEKKSVQQIAEERKLSPSTVLGHFTKLIKEKTVAISEFLPQEKIDRLTIEFQNYNEDSVTPMKERLGDEFTWDELRMFRASL
jgi:uncharacterized protein YpbB